MAAIVAVSGRARPSAMGLGCVKTLPGIDAPKILRPVVTRRTEKR
jgi:hypothetical protein